jgi:uncharacterized protein (UPF0210 family)
MINARTITVFQENVPDDIFLSDLEYIKEWLAFITPRTLRVSSISKSLLNCKDFKSREDIWGVSKKIDINRLDCTETVEKIVTDIGENKKSFYSVNIDEKLNVNSSVIFEITSLVRKVSLLGKKDGHSNFQLGIGFNIPEYTPYFPYSFSLKENYSKKTKVSIGLEIVNFIKSLIVKNSRLSLNDLSLLIKTSVEQQLAITQKNILELFSKHNSPIEFVGFDISLAPFPYLHGEASVVELVEALGNVGRSRSKIKFKFGDPGTQFTHTFFTNILKLIQQEHKIKTVGFCSAMYSVLEDNLLASYYSSKRIDYKNLMLLASTCGCGIDMLPLNCQVKDEEIYGYFLDTFCLSSKLKKPLGVRLLIDNNKNANSPTNYEDIFFSNLCLANSRNGPHFLKLPTQVNDKINFTTMSKNELF